MIKIILIFTFLFLITKQANATTLSEALLQAFNYNMELNAERENIKISKEELLSEPYSSQ